MVNDPVLKSHVVDVRSPDGKRNVRMRGDAGPDAVKRWNDIMEGWRAAEADFGRELSSRVPAVDLVNRETGRTERIPANGADKRARAHGMVERSNIGPVVLLARGVSGEWMPCGHRVSYGAAGRCSLCGEVS